MSFLKISRILEVPQLRKIYLVFKNTRLVNYRRFALKF